MSQENENKPDDLDFDLSGVSRESQQGDSAGNPFADDNFNPFAEDGGFAFGDGAATNAPTSDPGAFDFPAFGEAPAEGMPPFETPTAEPVTAEGIDDLPAPPDFPPGFPTDMSEGSAEASGEVPGESDAAVAEAEDAGMEAGTPIIEDGGAKDKKGKKAPREKKPKKEPGEKGESDPGAVFSLVCGILLLLGLIVFNIGQVLNPPPGVGFSSTIYYLVGVNVFGLCAALVPFWFFANREKNRSGDDAKTRPEDKNDIFKVALGVSVMVLSFGVILLMTALYRYDFTVKATSVPRSPARSAPVAPAPAEPAAESAPETPSEEAAESTAPDSP